MKLRVAFLCLLISAFCTIAMQAQQVASAKSEAKVQVETTTTVASQTEQEAVSEETEELYNKLANYLTGTKWSGKFSVTGMDTDELTEEAYYIMSAEKMDEGDYWKLVARIKYGKNDLTVPLPLEIKWAGETPVITVDQMLVPGLGKFDARVLIRNGKYSGTWAHNEVGGHLFGTIEKLTEEELKELEAEAEKSNRRR